MSVEEMGDVMPRRVRRDDQRDEDQAVETELERAGEEDEVVARRDEEAGPRPGEPGAGSMGEQPLNREVLERLRRKLREKFHR